MMPPTHPTPPGPAIAPDTVPLPTPPHPTSEPLDDPLPPVIGDPPRPGGEPPVGDPEPA